MNNFEQVNTKGRYDDLYKFFLADRRHPAGLKWLSLQDSQYLIKEYDGLMLDGDPTTAPSIIKWSSSQIDTVGFNGIGVKTERRTGRFVLGGNYTRGTNIVPVIKWAPSTAGAGSVNWQLNYEVINDGQIGGAGTVSNVIQLTNSIAWEMFTNIFPSITGTGFDIGSVFHFNLFRDPASDTYGADSALLSIGFYKQINTFGARVQFQK